MDKELRQELENSFAQFDTVLIPANGEHLQLASLSEVPMAKMAEFMFADNGDKLGIMSNLIKTCLINPNDFEKIETLPTKEFMRFVDQWMAESQEVIQDPNQYPEGYEEIDPFE